MRTKRSGDELVRVLVEIPKKLNKQQRELLQQFSETEDSKILPETKGFFEKLKKYFNGNGSE